MRFLFSITFNTCIYALLGIALNLPLGYGGMLLLCGVSFYGVGAYTYAIASHYYPEFLSIAIIAMALGAAVALLIGLVTVRLRGDNFAIATLGFQIIINSLFSNWIQLTGGPYGLRDVPSPHIGPWALEFASGHVWLAIITLGLVTVFCLFLLRLPYGRSLIAVRDSELSATALGKNPSYFRLTTLVMCGAITALAGALYASKITYIDALTFGLDEMMLILAVVIIGGAGTLLGPIFGALIIVILPELLRFLSFDDTNAGAIRQIILGITIVVLMRWRPQGLAGRYRFSANT